MADSDADRFLAESAPFMDFLTRVARRAASDATTAEDLVQRTYVEAFAHHASRRKDGSLRSWLAGILWMLVRNDRKKERLRPEHVAFDEEGDGVPLPHLQEDGLNAQHDVRAALVALPEEYRMVVVLVDAEGLTHEEVAAVLECPIGTVKSRLWRGRSLIERRLRTADVTPLRRIRS